MGIKESRRQTIESGSPLGHHNLNQQRVKSGDEGEIRYTHSVTPPEQAPLGARRTITIMLPLSEVFREAMFPFMLETAKGRVGSEANLTIPTRISNTAVDVYRIFKESKKLNLQTEMVNPPDLANSVLPIRRNFSPYPADSFYQMIAVKLKQLPGWQYFHESNRRILTTVLPRAYWINLTSTDFGLIYEEAVKDRGETYGYTLASIATALLRTFPHDLAQAADVFFPIFSDASQRYVRTLT